MRAVLDVNIFISYLLTPTSTGASSAVIRRLWAGDFTAITADPLFFELRHVVERSSYIRQRISSELLDALVERLVDIGEHVEVSGQRLVLPLRDPDDAYLFEMAFLADADFLVSGDLDVLALSASSERPAIVTPGQFLVMLATE